MILPAAGQEEDWEELLWGCRSRRREGGEEERKKEDLAEVSASSSVVKGKLSISPLFDDD